MMLGNYRIGGGGFHPLILVCFLLRTTLLRLLLVLKLDEALLVSLYQSISDGVCQRGKLSPRRRIRSRRCVWGVTLTSGYTWCRDHHSCAPRVAAVWQHSTCRCTFAAVNRLPIRRGMRCEVRQLEILLNPAEIWGAGRLGHPAVPSSGLS